MIRSLMCVAVAGLVLACSPDTRDGSAHAGDLIDALAQRCGQAFEGAVTSSDPRDADFASARLVMHIRTCSQDQVRVPFHVGEDRSRTWVLTRTGEGRIELKHDHRHEDGSEDVLTQYGGMSVDPVSGLSVDFPADTFSKALFEREGIPASMQNTWTMRIVGEEFVYALNRPERHFEARFDLSRPVDAPPAPWGAE